MLHTHFEPPTNVILFSKIDAGGKTTPNQASPGSAKGSMGSASVDSGIPEEPQPSDQQVRVYLNVFISF